MIEEEYTLSSQQSLIDDYDFEDTNSSEQS